MNLLFPTKGDFTKGYFLSPFSIFFPHRKWKRTTILHKYLETFHVFTWFPFTTSEVEEDYYHH